MAADASLAGQAQVAMRQASAPLLVDEREAGRLLGGLCGRTLYNLRQHGLPHVKVGSRVLYSPADLARWIEMQKAVSHE